MTSDCSDSLPHAVAQALEAERLDITRTAKQMGRELSLSELRRLQRLFSERVEKQLDSGSGSCFLRQPAVAQIVAGALRHFHAQRYRLFAWCVMPNHVHVVFHTHADYGLAKILHSWKSFTAKMANELLKRTGEFWQREYYDHIVRDQADFQRVVDYVVQNPAKTGLKNWPWVEKL